MLKTQALLLLRRWGSWLHCADGTGPLVPRP